ncbi:MAG TPA: M56 family metallopeptidase [Terracidiphilus sp.]|jgi:beta-lactamase regulating signal transducer with metallopeptidase domain
MSLVHISGAVLTGLGVSVKWAGAAFSSFAHAAAPAAVAALWQGLMVALVMVLCLRLLLRASAAHRFAAWAAGFVVAALLPLLPPLERSVEHLFEYSGASLAAATAPGSAARPWFELDSRWGLAIAALWLAASTFRAVELAIDLLRLRKLWRGATPVEAHGLRPLLAAGWSARRVQICTTPDLDRPSVIGFFAPRILIPDWLYPRLTPGELEQVVLHEAEHLRRRDDWTNLLQKLSLVLFPLNAGLAWMERRLCREREMACDEGVIERTQAPRSYAACLATLAEREFERRRFLRRAHALSLGAFGRRPELARRVHSILRRRPALHPFAAGALVSVVGCGLLVGAIELSRGPQMVAFVTAPATQAQSAALAPPPRETPVLPRVSNPQSGRQNTIPAASDAEFHPSEQFPEIATSAIRPASGKIVTQPPHIHEAHAGPTETAMTTQQDSRLREVPAIAETPAATASQSQEFVVFTAWQEVRTSAARTRTVADYDTGSNPQEQFNAAVGRPEQNGQSNYAAKTDQAGRGNQMILTQLILLVVPANSAPGSLSSATSDMKSDTKIDPKTGAKPARTSNSHRPIALDGGWLFFQL